MARYGLGARRDAPHKRTQRDARLHPTIRARLVSFPDSFSLASHEPARLDQGQTGSCTAHSGVASVYTAFAAAGMPLPFVGSPRELYAATRAIARLEAFPGAQTLPELTDDGAMPADVMQALGIYGYAPMRGPTPDGRNSDIWSANDTGAQPPNVDNEPDIIQLQQGAQTVITGEYRIDETAADVIDQCCAAIASNYPVYTCAFVDTRFMQWTAGTAPLGAPNMTDPNGGGHAIFLDAYTTSPSGKVFRLVNSWSAGWGDDGTCQVSEAWVRAAWDLYPMAVARRS